MDLYHVVLFAHIIGAVVIVGMGFFMPVVMGGARRAQTVSSLTDWLRVMQKMSKMAGPAAGLVLATGLYMGWAQFSFTQGWLAISLALFLLAGSIAAGVLDPLIAKALAVLDNTPEGPVTEDLRSVALPPKAHNIEALLFGVDLAIIFLMTNKPALLPALAVAASGFAIGALRIAISARRHVKPAVAA